MDENTNFVPIKQLFQLVNLDKFRLYIEPEVGGSLDFKFEVNPLDFIHFAELDFLEINGRGLINSLTNSKRAIDSEVDKVLNIFGLFSRKMNFPQKMEIFRQLGIITPRILSKVINRRNLLEHEYKIPNQDQVEDAIDVANLFILSLDNMLESFMFEFALCNDFFDDHPYYNPHPKYSGDNIEKQIFVDFDDERKIIDLKAWIYNINYTNQFSGSHMDEVAISTVTPKDACFTRLLALTNRSKRTEQETLVLYDCLLNSL